MQTVNLRFPIREKVNKKVSQAVDQFFAGSQNNTILESALRNAVTDMEFQSGMTKLAFGRLSK